jgi:hypothetical protein
MLCTGPKTYCVNVTRRYIEKLNELFPRLDTSCRHSIPTFIDGIPYLVHETECFHIYVFEIDSWHVFGTPWSIVTFDEVLDGLHVWSLRRIGCVGLIECKHLERVCQSIISFVRMKDEPTCQNTCARAK